MTRSCRIGQREIGPGQPVYVVAELSANHNGSFSRAVRLLEAAKSAGADAVKVQTYTPDTMTIDCDLPQYRVGGGTAWDGRTLHDLYAEAHTPWEWQPRLQQIAGSLGMDFFSTPFDATAVEWLERMDVPAYKIASFEIGDLELIRRVARTRKPTLISTGMSTSEEIGRAVEVAREAGSPWIALLKCTSAYPAPVEQMNLATIPHLARSFGTAVGLSDHGLGIGPPVAAVALGACVIEKHFTLSRDEPGPDSTFSLEPHEFRAMVEAVREASLALGKPSYGATERERSSLVFRRSLIVVRDVEAGAILGPDDVRCIRPGHGLEPRFLPDVLGRRATRDIARGTPLDWELVEAAAAPVGGPPGR